MAEYLNTFIDWFMGLGNQYGVNPVIFGSIYVGAIPFFTLSMAWIVRNYKKGKPLVLPVLSAVLFFISAYLYLLIAGENVPVWVYVLVVVMVGYGGWSSYSKLQHKLDEGKNDTQREVMEE